MVKLNVNHARGKRVFCRCLNKIKNGYLDNDLEKLMITCLLEDMLEEKQIDANVCMVNPLEVQAVIVSMSDKFKKNYNDCEPYIDKLVQFEEIEFLKNLDHQHK